VVDDVIKRGVNRYMVRNKKFHAYKAKAYKPTWSGKNDAVPSPTVIWAKDLQDAKDILHAGGHGDFIVIEARSEK
jgi:hypothetical protein